MGCLSSKNRIDARRGAWVRVDPNRPRNRPPRPPGPPRLINLGEISNGILSSNIQIDPYRRVFIRSRNRPKAQPGPPPKRRRGRRHRSGRLVRVAAADDGATGTGAGAEIVADNIAIPNAESPPEASSIRRNFYRSRLVDDENRLCVKSTSSAKATDSLNQTQDNNGKSADGDSAGQNLANDGVGGPPPGGPTGGAVDALADASGNSSTGGGEADGAGEAAKNESDPDPAEGDGIPRDVTAVDAAGGGDAIVRDQTTGGTIGGGVPISGSDDAPEPNKPADDPPVNNAPVEDSPADKQVANKPPLDKVLVDYQAKDDLSAKEQAGDGPPVDQASFDFPPSNWGSASAKSGDQASTRSSHHIHGKKKKQKRKTQSVRDV